MRFFFFGLLRDRDILELVLGRPAQRWPLPCARLAGFHLARLRGDSFPLLLPAPGGAVEGIVVEDFAEAELDRLHFFESVEYAPRPVQVELAEGGMTEAHIFAATERAHHDDEEWHFEDWLARHKARDLRESELWMALYGHLSIAEADRLWDEALAEGRSLEDVVGEVLGAPCGART